MKDLTTPCSPAMADHPDPPAGLAALFSAGLLAWLAERGCSSMRLVLTNDQTDRDASFVFPLPSDSNCLPAGRLLFFDLQLGDDEASLLRNFLQASCQLTAWTPVTVDSLPAKDICLVSCQAADRLLHDIRNRLNSLLMSAGVLYTAPASAELTKRFAAQIESDGKSCADELSQLGHLFRRPPANASVMLPGRSPSHADDPVRDRQPVK